MFERAEARIDLDAMRHNCRELRGRIGSDVELCPVLKADGYGHGAHWCAEAVAAAGVDRIAVATAREAAQIRSMVPDVPLLPLGALTSSEADLAVTVGTDVGVWDRSFIGALSSRAQAAGTRLGIHVKYDTGMGRLGCSDPDEVIDLAGVVAADPNLDLVAFWTHFATADEADSSFLVQQRDRLAELGDRVRSEFPEARLHAANSAALIADPECHFDMVRPGVAVYGMDPFGRDPGEHNLHPVMSFHSWVASVKPFSPGMSAGYGRTWTASQPTRIATVPVGYGDGVRRGLSNRGQVLINGQRFNIAGTISMDNITVDIGDEAEVSPGDEVVVIGAQVGERITAEEVARDLDTINYEVTCGISPRVPRQQTGGGA